MNVMNDLIDPGLRVGAEAARRVALASIVAGRILARGMPQPEAEPVALGSDLAAENRWLIAGTRLVELTRDTTQIVTATEGPVPGQYHSVHGTPNSSARQQLHI